MKRHVALAGLVGLLLCSGFSTSRAEGGSCRTWSDFPAFTYAKVTVSKAFFRDDNLKPRSEYLVKGDIVAVRNVKPYGTCAVFISKDGIETIGWLRVNALRDISLKPAFVGSWSFGEAGEARADLRISSARGEGFTVKGSASTPTAGGSVNIGEVSGKLILSQNAVLYNQDGCQLSGLWLNGFLSVVDNDSCGGLNVSFTGVFKRNK